MRCCKRSSDENALRTEDRWRGRNRGQACYASALGIRQYWPNETSEPDE